MEKILALMHRKGLRAGSISITDTGISVEGVTPLPPTPEESVYEGAEMKAREERIREDKRLLGLE